MAIIRPSTITSNSTPTTTKQHDASKPPTQKPLTAAANSQPSFQNAGSLPQPIGMSGIFAALGRATHTA